MQTLHLRAEESVIQKIMGLISQFSKNGAEVELLDNVMFDVEHGMIQKALNEEKQGMLHKHEDIWKDIIEI
ncbi:MAG: hypothetical protein Q8R58_07215 [Sulfuricurvum sp.]|nr:hypothetical protein [Sulfuricurvum sp.]